MRKLSYLSVILFIIAAWFTIFFFWNFIENNNFVGNAINTGNITFRGNEYEIVNYFMSSSAPYAFYALTTGVLGWVLMKLKERRVTELEKTSIVNVTKQVDAPEISHSHHSHHSQNEHNSHDSHSDSGNMKDYD